MRAYIVGLEVPDRVSHLFSKLVRELIGVTGEDGAKKEVYGYLDAGGTGEEKRASKVTTWPMEPMVPILVCLERPKPPVTGLMPLCETTIEVRKRLMLDRPSRWLTLPVDSNDWFENLRQKLSNGSQKQRTATYREDPVLPLCLGLPLLYIDECEEKTFSRILEVNIDRVGGWRALTLICWEIEYLANRPWHQSVYWVPIWKRRLRRAIGASK